MKINKKEVINSIKEIYKNHPSGGALHIVLDDYNIDDEYIISCITEFLNNYINYYIKNNEPYLIVYLFFMQNWRRRYFMKKITFERLKKSYKKLLNLNLIKADLYNGEGYYIQEINNIKEKPDYILINGETKKYEDYIKVDSVIPSKFIGINLKEVETNLYEMIKARKHHRIGIETTHIIISDKCNTNYELGERR